MTIAFVLGNGISRQGVDFVALKTYGKIYGCNALYRDYVPDVLVATDRPIATEIQNSGYAKKNVFYTRRPLEGLGARSVPQPYFGYSSGPIATSLAAIDGHRQVYLLGFDMGPKENNQFNNIYAGTDFYKPPNALPTFTGNWVKQLVRIMNDHPLVQFVRICGETTARITELDAITNLVHQDLTTFKDRINNKKDL
jgi:hypothetical protein